MLISDATTFASAVPTPVELGQPAAIQLDKNPIAENENFRVRGKTSVTGVLIPANGTVRGEDAAEVEGLKVKVERRGQGLARGAGFHFSTFNFHPE